MKHRVIPVLFIMKTQEKFLHSANMLQSEWNDLYSKVYDAYEYSSLKNEVIRVQLGDLLDYLIQIKGTQK